MRAHNSNIADDGSRPRIRATLHDLHVHLTHARAMFSPQTYVGNPWLRFAAAVAVGYRLGSREEAKPAGIRPAQRETLVHALVRTALLNIAESTINEAMTTTEQENHDGRDKRQAQR